jgi:ribonuclease HII
MANCLAIDDAKEQARLSALFQHERRLWAGGARLIAGVDEAGRGPLAGPVAAAAVVFATETLIPGLNDSKLLKAKQRGLICDQIFRCAAAVSVGIATVEEIDCLNILRASLLAMKRAIEGLEVKPDHLLVDGNFEIPEMPYPQTALVKGDRLSASVAAASIVAKVHRDRWMEGFHREFPQYGFDRHKGYATQRHIRAIETHGRCEIHRRSFHLRGEIDLFKETGRQ